MRYIVVHKHWQNSAGASVTVVVSSARTIRRRVRLIGGTIFAEAEVALPVRRHPVADLHC
jgi:hypothetical protein